MLTVSETTDSPTIFRWQLSLVGQKLVASGQWHAHFFYISGGTIANYELILETEDVEETSEINCRLGLVVEFISRPIHQFDFEFSLSLLKEETNPFELVSQVVQIDTYQWEYWLPVETDLLRRFIASDTLLVGVKTAVVSRHNQLDATTSSVSLIEEQSQQNHSDHASSPVEDLATDHSEVPTTHSKVNVELPRIKRRASFQRPFQRSVSLRTYRKPKVNACAETDCHQFQKITQQVTVRSLILYGFNQNKSTTETLQMICNTMGPRAVSISTVRKWYKQFRNGNSNTYNSRPSRSSN
ncbi:hypothetical protein M3Y98_01056300 [Aphelenchoides besseyi]|nr:hypothetical protein M3Y98_01056300 [Aphelenchoides besseyi]